MQTTRRSTPFCTPHHTPHHTPRSTPRSTSHRTARRSSIVRDAVELLEPRRLFAVNVVNPIAPVTLPAGAVPATVPLGNVFDSTTVDGTIVRFAIGANNTTFNLDLELFDSLTPGTATNFLRYVNGGLYTNTFFHRAVRGFVVQGGGYSFPSGNAISKFPTIVNEFTTSPRDALGRVNTAGTVAMAKLGGNPDSASSEWFVNLGDNSDNLDNQNGGFTTFARVRGDGLTRMQAIGNGQITNFEGGNPDGTFSTVPTTNAASASQATEPNFYIVRSTTVLSALTFTVTSADPAKLTAGIDSGGNVILTPQPTATGTIAVTVRAVDADGATNAATFNVTLTPAATLAVSSAGNRINPSNPAGLSLGTLLPGAASSSVLELTFRNTGSELLTLTAPTLPSGFTFSSIYPPQLVAGEQQTVLINLPVDSTGPRSANLVFPNSGSLPDFSIPLSYSVPVSSLAFNRDGIDITPGTNSFNLGALLTEFSGPNLLFTLRNTGFAPIDLTGISLPTGVTLLGTLPSRLVGGEQRPITLVFPASVSGPASGVIAISNTGATPNFSFPVGFEVRQGVILGPSSTVGQASLKSVTFTQGTGTNAVTATLTLSGPGRVTLGFATDSELARGTNTGSTALITGDARISTLLLDGTTTSSTLTLTAARGSPVTALVDIGALTTVGTASLGSLIAKQGRITGNFTLGATNATTASLRTLTVAQIVNSTINLGTNTTRNTTFSLTADRIVNSGFLVNYPVRSVTVGTWVSTPTSPQFRAASVGTFTVRSDFSNTVVLTGSLTTAAISGRLTGGLWDINGAVNRFSAQSSAADFRLQTSRSIPSITFRDQFSGTLIAQEDIKSFSAGSTSAASINARNITTLSVRGELNGTVSAQGDIGTISAATTNGARLFAAGFNRVAVAGSVTNSLLAADFNINTFSAAALAGSSIYAGVKPLPQGQDFPTSTGTNSFQTTSFIRTLTLTNKGVVNAFSNSVISALQIGTLNLGNVELVNGTTPNRRTGIAADLIVSLSFRTPTGQRESVRGINAQSLVPQIVQPAGATSDFRITIL
jgi:cyclophilin family peptidyl-prolyl cis-trans isomerase